MSAAMIRRAAALSLSGTQAYALWNEPRIRFDMAASTADRTNPVTLRRPAKPDVPAFLFHQDDGTFR